MSETTAAAPQTVDPAEGAPVLHVCVTCRRGLTAEAIEESGIPGRVLFEQLTAQADEAGITVKSVECLASCNRGCSAAVSMPERWTLLLGDLGPEKVGDLMSWLDLYRASKRGIVPASKRPPSLANMLVARLPAAIAPA